ncbi:nitrate transporter [Brevirhabdus pacifica]|uniref:Nitrate transporter n=1 Tax=Brevirhabdus pacifica TaxID=1267768 RepID=A0A1U7DGR4_9RHOB|nr:ABC transporter substrate-binding protein [Brevirhabdus pacifica]APX89172.1 nitrate transporter [Brevirhabdus pacifica]PJJ86233.1 NitT/TauT family transport system ATP-binding protein [Brevirhabdus pacifica]
MTPRLPVGFVPLTDAAPLIVAVEMGFDRAEGIALDLRRANSWSVLRDMVSFGQVTAAQMLSPMPVASALGLGGAGAPLAAVAVLSLNGEVICVGNAIADRLRASGHDFGFEDMEAAGRALLAAAPEGLRVGVPFPFSMHAELLHDWMRRLRPTEPPALDIRTVPPPLMAAALAAGEIDAFCVGEPWGSMAVERGAGALLLPGVAIRPGASEKILGVRADLADRAPDQLHALIRALWHAGRWLTDPQSRVTACEMMSGRDYLDVPAEVLDRALSGELTISPRGETRKVDRFIDFGQGAPRAAEAAWIADRLAERLGREVDPARRAAKDTFRTDLYARAVAPVAGFAPLGESLPRPRSDHEFIPGPPE